MSNVKSIRKCDDKVTAADLGVKKGDRFVVLPPAESYREEKHYRTFSAGMVVELVRDDQTCCPEFKIAGTSGKSDQEWGFEYFSCLARYEDYYKQPEKETEMKQNDDVVLENVKFNMAAIAADLGVSLENAHKIVQPLLFENGVKWPSNGNKVCLDCSKFLFIGKSKHLLWDNEDDEGYKELSVKLQPVFYIKEQPKEVVEFNGKRYNKKDLEKALALLSPVSE